jgi:hypothetical protein
MIRKLVILCVLIGASCFGAHGFSQEWKFDRPVIGTYTEVALPSNASPGAIARVSDGARGLRMYSGSKWVSINGNELDADEFTSLSDAITAIGPSDMVLGVASNHVIASSQTVPSNIVVKLSGLGRFTISAGQTLTIDGPLVAPLRQIFPAVAES